MSDINTAQYTEADFAGKVLDDPTSILAPGPDKPIFRIEDGNIDSMLAQMEQLLYPTIYVRGSDKFWIGLPAELERDVEPRASDRRKILPITVAYVVRTLCRRAQIEKYDARAKGYKPTDCPDRLASKFIEYGNHPKLRPLDAIVHAPFVREDGSVCDKPGYDSRSRCFYDPIAEYPELTESVSKEEARAALDRLMIPFEEFPFKDRAMRAAFMAHVLTEAARPAIDRAPMFVYSAPDAGTGKSLLSEMPASIVHGEEPALRPWVSDSDELRKTLFASLMSGDRSIAFDNVPTGEKIRAPGLCAFLTSAVWKDRKLGASDVRELPNNAVVSTTGNNVTPVGDLARRCLVIRLDANTDNIKGRTFKIPNLRAYVKENRVDLLMSALTIIRGHKQSGHVGLTPLASFETWSRTVRDALLWLGMADPVESQAAETDDESSTLDEAFSILTQGLGNQQFTPGDVAKLVNSVLHSDGKLSTAMISAGCSAPAEPQKVGYWLRTCRDKLAAGWKL